ncbi:OmpA family protein [Fibrobacterota bacterium]
MDCKSMTRLLILATALLTGNAVANNINAGGEKGLIRTMTTETHGLGALTFGGAIKGDWDDEYAIGPNGNYKTVFNINTRQDETFDASYLYSGDLYLVYGFHQAWDIGIDLPIYHDRTGWGQDHTSFGNLEITSKLRYPFNQDEFFINHAYFVRLALPTGAMGSGHFPRHAYYIEQKDDPIKDSYASTDWAFNPMMLWTMHFDRLNGNVPLKLHVNFGGAINSSSAVTAAIGLEYFPVENLSLFLETSGESRVIHYINDFSFYYFDNDIWLVTPGVKYEFPNGMHASLAVDIAIADYGFRSEWRERKYEFSTKGAPLIGVQFSLGWTGLRKLLDSDKDGIINKLDKCPQDKEDMDGFEDDDGCPEIDNDNDGLLDAKDKCPNTPTEVHGCPVEDVDKDGIDNKDDKCPEKAEDFDKFQDEDGCPDDDNDNDMVLDADDKCPQKPEDDDGFEDNDGCPDVDNDADGLRDAEDKCPNHKGLPENQGCPKTQEIKRGEPMLLNVSFMTGNAKLNVNSYTILDQVVESLTEWKDVKLEIQGHTDNTGTMEVNMKLSQARAESVRNYLIQKGVEPGRLKAVGYGPTVPIADNTTAEGRERNRRVQLKRTD